MNSDIERPMEILVANGFHQMNLKNFDDAIQIFDDAIQNTTEIGVLLLAHQGRAICKTNKLDMTSPVEQISNIEDDLKISLMILAQIRNSFKN